MLAVLAHLEPPNLLARCLASALKPNGVLIVLTHTNWCDPDTAYKTDRFDLELRRFLDCTAEAIVACDKLEQKDRQGREHMTRRLLTYKNSRALSCGGARYHFWAAGGVSRVFLADDGKTVCKWFEVECERRELHARIHEIVEEEVRFLREVEPIGFYPAVIESGERHVIMEYRGEQGTPRTWPANWAEQVKQMQTRLVAFGRPLGDVALENMLIDKHGHLSLIDPVFIDGIHKPEYSRPETFAARITGLVEKNMNRRVKI